ncbi:MAG: response regulator [Candidatus Omnitrophica bacterium]|nr:response regulator [Candidatus Omnitrophota bacterium]
MKKILIIDDEKDFCFFVSQNLELTGKYKVVVTNSSKDGLSAALRHKPDVILLDILMPGMNGFEVLAQLKGNQDTTTIPVIMLTAIDTEESKEKAVGLYNEDYITKPVDIASLNAKIDSVLSRSRG